MKCVKNVNRFTIYPSKLKKKKYSMSFLKEIGAFYQQFWVSLNIFFFETKKIWMKKKTNYDFGGKLMLFKVYAFW
jgi:hypothetical protein